MNVHQFATLYADAQEHRDQLRRNSTLSTLFPPQSRRYPPVLGFGLPRDDRPVPVVTVALNASAGEFPDHLPTLDDAQKQWNAQTEYFFNKPYQEWWGLAGRMLREATNGRVTYDGSGSKAAHIDFTAVVTEAGTDTAYAAVMKQVREDVRRSWMGPSLSLFLSLLSHLVSESQTKAVLVMGFAPGFRDRNPTGGIMLKDTFWRSNEQVNFVAEDGIAGEAGKPTVAWGRLIGDAIPGDLSGVPLFFVSQGPSSLLPAQRSDPEMCAPLIAAAGKLASRIEGVLGPPDPPLPGYVVRRRPSRSEP